jgi:hypothetical protein
MKEADMSINPLRLKLAAGQTLSRLLRKLPIVIFAAFACYGLYYLDSVKRDFDDSKEKPIVVEANYRNKLQNKVEAKVEGGKAAWSEIEHYVTRIDRPASNGAELISRLNEEVIAEKDSELRANEQFALTELNQCAAEKRQALARKESPAKSKKSAPPPQPVTESTSSQCFTQYLASTNTYRQEAEARAANKINKIYEYIRPNELEEIKTDLAQPEGGLRNSSSVREILQPTLDEKSGLYIIYQIFRISFIVIIVFSLIVMIALLLRTLLVTDSAATFTEQARALISGKEMAVAGAARAAVISVAALGVGTAVATGVAISSNRPTVSETPTDQGSKYELALNRQRPNRGGALNQSLTQEELLNALQTYQAFNTNLPPQVDVPTPEAYIFPRFRMPSATLVPDADTTKKMSDYFGSSSRLLETMKTKIESLSSPAPPAKDISVANLKDAMNTPEPLKVDLAGLVGPGTTSVGDTLKSLQTSLEKIDTLNTNLSNLERPLNPVGRNVFHRLLGTGYVYLASPQAVTKLKNMMQWDPQNAPIWKALDLMSMSGEPPATEKEFLKVIESKFPDIVDKMLLAQGSAQSQPDLTREQMLKNAKSNFEKWKKTILSYTRLP